MDIDKEAKKRKMMAALYYRNTGRTIEYLDEGDKRKIYVPDAKDELKRKGYLETMGNVNSLYNWMIITSILSLSFGLFVGVFYLRNRKINKYEALAHNI